ncbi:hypothetical protein C8R43DRAFT_960421 [Mycena crocata]|nr:hypothetical protein C8R43DRAFT_960421 [Mycena crocata]
MTIGDSRRPVMQIAFGTETSWKNESSQIKGRSRRSQRSPKLEFSSARVPSCEEKKFDTDKKENIRQFAAEIQGHIRIHEPGIEPEARPNIACSAKMGRPNVTITPFVLCKTIENSHGNEARGIRRKNPRHWVDRSRFLFSQATEESKAIHAKLCKNVVEGGRKGAQQEANSDTDDERRWPPVCAIMRTGTRARGSSITSQSPSISAAKRRGEVDVDVVENANPSVVEMGIVNNFPSTARSTGMVSYVVSSTSVNRSSMWTLAIQIGVHGEHRRGTDEDCGAVQQWCHHGLERMEKGKTFAPDPTKHRVAQSSQGLCKRAVLFVTTEADSSNWDDSTKPSWRDRWAADIADGRRYGTKKGGAGWPEWELELE